MFWLGVWWLAAVCVDREVLLPAPDRVAVRLWELGATREFWATVALSLLRITLGFLAGAVLGTLTGILTARLTAAEQLMAPLMTVIKATPVASFIILARVWIEQGAIPVFIAFLMVFPIIQSSVFAGIRSTSRELLEMARVYEVPALRRLGRLYVPAALPYFAAGCRSAFGLSWKAGVAAEVISVPMRSIGRQLYFSKLYLDTPDLFAWTVSVILLSLALEALLNAGLRKLTKGGGAG